MFFLRIIKLITIFLTKTPEDPAASRRFFFAALPFFGAFGLTTICHFDIVVMYTAFFCGGPIRLFSPAAARRSRPGTPLNQLRRNE